MPTFDRSAGADLRSGLCALVLRRRTAAERTRACSPAVASHQRLRDSDPSHVLPPLKLTFTTLQSALLRRANALREFKGSTSLTAIRRLGRLAAHGSAFICRRGPDGAFGGRTGKPRSSISFMACADRDVNRSARIHERLLRIQCLLFRIQKLAHVDRIVRLQTRLRKTPRC